MERKQSSKQMDDDLRSEYDLKGLQIRKLGPGRKRFWDTVRLEADLEAGKLDRFISQAESAIALSKLQHY